MSSTRFGRARPPRRTIGVLAVIAVAVLPALVGVSSADAATSSASAAPSTAGLTYVAIGDSYSSGLGVGDVNPAVPSDCGQSLDNFPHQVAAQLGLELTDVTCSGAQAENLTTVPQPVNGTTVPVQTAALSADTDIVTITVGGNGLKFTTVASACAAASKDGPLIGPGLTSLSSCQQIPDIAALPSRIPLLGQVIGTTYAAVRAAAPNAKIFVLGYPSIAPDDVNLPASGSCFSSVTTPGGFPFTDADTPFLHTIEKALDDTVQVQAAAAGFTYVPTFENSLAHSACAPAADSYVNGVYVDFTVPTAPVIQEKSLHPNANGVGFMTQLADDAITESFPVTVPPPATPTPTPTGDPAATSTPTPTAAVPASTPPTAAAAPNASLAATGVSDSVLMGTAVMALVLLLTGAGLLLTRRRRHS